MYVLKGDLVRTKAKGIGEVIEIWGFARTFFKLKRDDGTIFPVMESDVAEIVHRPTTKHKGRR